jgi:hypothetical protein
VASAGCAARRQSDFAERNLTHDEGRIRRESNRAKNMMINGGLAMRLSVWMIRSFTTYSTGVHSPRWIRALHRSGVWLDSAGQGAILGGRSKWRESSGARVGWANF